MSAPQALHHALLRPCVLHVLRAAGFHSTRPSVLDAFTDIAARYMITITETAIAHAAVSHPDPELALGITLDDVRMAMEDRGVLYPDKPLVDQDYDGEEDTRGMDAFLAWVKGPQNRELKRIALEGGDGVRDDYLTVLKKKHMTADDDSRYNGTVLGKPAEPRSVKVEGGDLATINEWTEKMKKSSQVPSNVSSRRQSSALSSLGDEEMEDMDF